MADAAVFPPVTASLLDTIVRRILAVGSPHRIVLFGSHARKDARPDSDLHLLIIEESDIPRYRRTPRYLKALVGVYPAKYIVVWTPDEMNQREDVKKD